MSITLTQLSAFLAVVRTGSVTGAAEELVVTQPTVSSALAALGRELGCELFERSGRGVKLSPAGEAFAPYAIDVLGLLERGREAALEAGALALRRVRIAAVTTAAESFVPPLVRAWIQTQPDTDLVLDVGNRDEVFERVLTHAADVAISGTPPGDDRLVARPLMVNAIACIAAPEDPLVAGQEQPASALGERTWLLREPGSGTRSLAVDYMLVHGLAPRTLTLGSNGAIRQAARAGLGIALISRIAVADELDAGSLAEIRFSGSPSERWWYVVQSAVGPRRPLVSAFIEFVSAQVSGVTASPTRTVPGASTRP